MKIDHEAVYALRDLQTDCLSNLQVQYRNQADERAQKDFEVFESAIAKHIGTNDFLVTNSCCIAKGILHHVYTPIAGVAGGVGQRKCIFCGLDDFDI